MSSRVVINTLKFCTACVETLMQALSILKIESACLSGDIHIGNYPVEQQSGILFMRINQSDNIGAQLFNKINSKIAEIESQLKALQVERNTVIQAEAREAEEMHRVRQIQKEQERLKYERKQLELESQSFVDAKKQAIIDRAKAMGYSVQERIENGTVKLKLIKRIY